MIVMFWSVTPLQVASSTRKPSAGRSMWPLRRVVPTEPMTQMGAVRGAGHTSHTDPLLRFAGRFIARRMGALAGTVGLWRRAEPASAGGAETVWPLRSTTCPSQDVERLLQIQVSEECPAGTCIPAGGEGRQGCSLCPGNVCNCGAYTESLPVHTQHLHTSSRATIVLKTFVNEYLDVPTRSL